MEKIYFYDLGESLQNSFHQFISKRAMARCCVETYSMGMIFADDPMAFSSILDSFLFC